MGKNSNMKYETPKDPANGGTYGARRDPEGSRQGGTYGARRDPEGQTSFAYGARREREREIRAPQFLNFSKFIYFLIFPITLGRFLFLAN